MLKKLLLALVTVIVLLAVLVVMQPTEFHVTREATIAAPPDVVFDQINNLHKWQEWSPWAKLDPNCKITYEGPDSGKGAVFGWSGNNEVGEGKMTIVESKPGELVTFRLEFVKPFAGTNLAQFKLLPQGAGTNVEWSMTGDKNFLMKAIGLFMNCDKMLGPQFEKGLAQLKAVSEAAAPKETP